MTRALVLESIHPLGPGHGIRVLDGSASPGPARVRGADVPDTAVLLAGATRSLRRELSRTGLAPTGRLIHLPDLGRSRMVFPSTGPALRFARRDASSPLRGIAIGVVALAPGTLVRHRTSELWVPRGGPGAFDWIARLEPALPSCSALAVTNGRPGAAAVLLRFCAAPEPDLVIKVGDRAAREAEGLRTVAPGAGEAGALVPRLTWEGEQGGIAVAAQTPLHGEPALRWVRGAGGRADALLERVAEWLRRWNESSASVQPLSRDLLERWLLAPAARLAPELRRPGYVERLHALCEACAGARIPLVAAHNDLTVANLVVNGSALGVIDWEESTADGLPLRDLAYAIADRAAAVDGYADRPGAYDAVFGRARGRHGPARALIAESARVLGLGPEVAEMCLHACWLHHAANELDRAVPGAPERPFLEILRRAAATEAAPAG